MGAGHHSRARRLSFLAVVFLFGVVMLAQANVKNAAIAQIRLHEMPWPSARLERGNPCWQGVSFESQARLSLDLRIGILCGGDPVNNFDPDGRMSKDSYKDQNAPSFSLTAVPNQWSFPDYLVRKEDPMLVDQVLAAGYPKPPGGSLADTVINGSHDAGYPASTTPGGAPNINGEPLWIDANQVKANGGTIAQNEQIVAALRQSGVPESQIRIYQGNQPVEGEVVIQGAIPGSAINTRAMTYVVRGGQVFAVAAALNTGINLGNSINRSIDQGTPTPFIAQSVREAGGWGGAWAGFQAGAGIGAAAGIETGPGALLTGLGGGIVGGIAGYTGANWIGNKIEGK